MPPVVDLATPDDDAAIRALLARESMPGRIRLGYLREPEFRLGCEATAENYQILVAREKREVIGVACRSVLRVLVNGCEQRVGYLGQLRVDSRFRGRWLVSRGFSRLRQLHDEDPLPGYLMSIVGGNDEASGVLIESRRKSFPEFRPVADYRTFAIGIGRKRRAIRFAGRLATAQAGELAEVAEFLRAQGAKRQFFSAWTKERLARLSPFGLRTEDLRIARRDGKIVGVAGLWDQSAYKQTVVHGYSGWLKAAAPFYNLAAPWFGRAPLPRPGEKLRSVYLSLLCIAEDELAVFRALLRDLYNLAADRGFQHLILGLDFRDPMLPVASEYSHVVYSSQVYLAEWPYGGSFYEQLDRRPVYIESAIL